MAHIFLKAEGLLSEAYPHHEFWAVTHICVIEDSRSPRVQSFVDHPPGPIEATREQWQKSKYVIS